MQLIREGNCNIEKKKEEKSNAQKKAQETAV